MKDRRRASRESMAWTLAFEHHEDHAPTHGYGDARSGDGGIREELAAEVEASGGVPRMLAAARPRTDRCTRAALRAIAGGAGLTLEVLGGEHTTTAGDAHDPGYVGERLLCI